MTDGAKRDRLIWTGDVAIENLLGDYSLRAAPAIIRRSLQAFSCLQRSDGQVAPDRPDRDPVSGVVATGRYAGTAVGAAGVRGGATATGVHRLVDHRGA